MDPSLLTGVVTADWSGHCRLEWSLPTGVVTADWSGHLKVVVKASLLRDDVDEVLSPLQSLHTLQTRQYRHEHEEFVGRHVLEHL